MRCSNCGNNNPIGAKTCTECGADLSASADALVGQTVGGRYEIVERIGEGGMGVVYRAEQRLGSATRNVALKTLHAHFSNDPAVTARFHREVGTVAQLEHPNTVRVYDFGSTEDGSLYIAMEFLAGRSLGDELRRSGSLPLGRAANIVRQIAGSLDEAHAQGIVHRDLKPENVLLVSRAGEDDFVKLVDFGIAARTEGSEQAQEKRLTQQGMVLGTPPYMSPEQFTGKPLDARSDVYSLGVMAYEMLTGQLPFEADSTWQWATAHMTQQPREPVAPPSGSEIPNSARQAVLTALAKEPDQRQPSAGEFYRALTEESVLVAPVSPRTQAMEATPAAGPAATVGMPAASVATPAVALPPAPPRSRAKKGSNGLIIALAAMGGVLLVAMGVVAFGGGDSNPAGPIVLAPTPPPASEPGASSSPAADTPAGRGGSGSTAPSGSTTAEAAHQSPPSNEAESASPETKPSSPAQAKPAASEPKATKPTASKPKATKPKPATSKPKTPKTKPAPPKTKPPVTRPKPARPAPSQAVDHCRACSEAAKAGQFETAVAHYKQCRTAARKACQRTATASAGQRARRAAFNGKCAEAKEIIRQAEQLGVASSRFADARRACP